MKETTSVQVETVSPTPEKPTFLGRFKAHLQIMRLDHSIKNIFVIPGIVVPLSVLRTPLLSPVLVWHILIGFLATTLIACSNYVINEVLDAPFDRLHPIKRTRPAALGLVSVPIAYAQWILMMIVGIALAHMISHPFTYAAGALWIMGCIYNISPCRTKDRVYLDVLSESVNNPIRLAVGWYIVTSTVIPPVSLLVAYWMLGAYFMALKRFSEYRQIGSAPAMRYRKSFEYYTEESLLTSVLFYAATAMLFFGAFVMRYRIEMVLSFPLIALLMAVYFDLGFAKDSPVQNPEKLYREPRLMVLLAVCAVVLIVTSFIHLPWLAQMFPKSSVR